MELVKYILTILFSAAGLGGIVIYLGKRLIDKSLDLGIENYKNTLARNLEVHRNELEQQQKNLRQI